MKKFGIDLAAYHLTSIFELPISEDEGMWLSDAPMQLIVRAYGETAKEEGIPDAQR